MINQNPFRMKLALKMQLLKIEYNIEDERLNDLFGNFTAEDMYGMVFEFIHESVQKLFTFPYEEYDEYSEEMEESLQDDCEFSLEYVITIPGLLPYVDHPVFPEFIQHMQNYVAGAYSDYVEMVYLPWSGYASLDAEPFERQFADQPGTFYIAVHNYGGFDPDILYKIAMMFMRFDHYINKLIA